MLPNTGPDTAPASPPIYSEPTPDSDAKTTTIDSQGAIETADTETVSSPNGTDPIDPAPEGPVNLGPIDPAPKGPVNLGPLPNPNLNLPKPNNPTIPNLKDTTLDLPPKTPPKSDTTTGSGGGNSGGTKPGTTTGGTTSGGTKPGTTTGGTTSGGTKTGTNTNANSLTKGTTSTSK
jgi:hypothetical protein